MPITMRLPFHIVVLFLVLLQVGCDALLPTESLRPGEVSLYVHMPVQKVLVDDSGRTFYVRQVIAHLGEPTLRAADGSVLRGEVHASEFPLFPNEEHLWARFSVSGPVKSMTANLAPAPGVPVALTILGSYNALATGIEQGNGETMSSFSWVVPLDLPLPDPERIEADGGRYRLVLDPSRWVLDDESRDLLAIERLLGEVPNSSALSQALRSRLIASAHIERF